MLIRCKRCLYPETKPDLHFSADGLCSACASFDARQEIDWAARANQFLELVSANRGKSHDVIVACSGGKDSTWQVIKCLDLGLKPLAVTATTDSLSELGRKNLDNISNLCDHIEITPNKAIRSKISKFALETVGDISWCEHHLIWSVPAREALARNIPIVLYGECPQNEYGGPPGTEVQTRLTNAWVHEFGGLLGLRLSDVQAMNSLGERDLDIYRYPQTDAVQSVFMGAYFEWDGYRNFETALKHGFTPYSKEVEGSLGSFENLDNKQTGLHDALRYYKFGYGRATDIASNAIRRGRMTRAEATVRVKDREGKFPWTYLGYRLEDILAEINMTVDEVMTVIGKFANKKLFEMNNGIPVPKFEVA